MPSIWKFTISRTASLDTPDDYGSTKRCITIITPDSAIVMPLSLDAGTVLNPFTVTFRDAGLLSSDSFETSCSWKDTRHPRSLSSRCKGGGNMFARKNTCRITGVSVDFQRQRLHVVWHVVDRLPHDSLWLRAVRITIHFTLNSVKHKTLCTGTHAHRRCSDRIFQFIDLRQSESTTWREYELFC